MKKLSILFIASLLLLAVLPSCRKVEGSGPVVTEERGITGFSEVKSQLSADVYLTPGSAYSVKIEAQQNIIDAIETVLNDGILTLRVKHNTVIRTDSRVRIYVTAPGITGLTVDGSGNMMTLDPITANNLYLKVSGSGNITIMKLTASSVDAHISGSGEININNGTVSTEEIDITGSGSMDFSNLMAGSADIDIAGSGDARVFVTGHMKVRISGSGNVYYRGTPSVDVGISGSGKLKPM